MNCREYQEQLYELLGESRLPKDIGDHLAHCAECRRVWSELTAIREELGNNVVFYPEPHETELVAELVEREIRSGGSMIEVRPMAWLRYVAVAAAVALVSITATMWKWSDQAGQVVVKSDSLAMNADTTHESSEDELPGYAVSTLLEDFAGRTSYSAGEELLGELTDEEAAYLETELKAGDLL